MIVDATRAMILSGEPVTMPAIARAAGVSEATAYRYFPDLLAIMQAAFVGVWPSAEDLFAEDDADPVERVAMAAEFLTRNLLTIQGAVRTMISLAIVRTDAALVRPYHRLGLIDAALASLADADGPRLEQLRNDLAVVISAESLFTLLDIKNLSADAAVQSLTETARGLVRIALHDLDTAGSGRSPR